MKSFTFTMKATVSFDAGDEVIMSIAGHVSRAMLSRYSHVRMEEKRRALDEIAARQCAAKPRAFRRVRHVPAVGKTPHAAPPCALRYRHPARPPPRHDERLELPRWRDSWGRRGGPRRAWQRRSRPASNRVRRAPPRAAVVVGPRAHPRHCRPPARTRERKAVRVGEAWEGW